jgi:hypothetical protein
MSEASNALVLPRYSRLGVDEMTGMRRALLATAMLIVGNAVAFGGPVSESAAQARTLPNPSAAKLDDVTLAILIKSAIIAVQHANMTGNYSVLRDLGTPGFRERYDQAKLTAIFANFRARGINLSPSLMLMPNLTRPVELSPTGHLRVVGNFPTLPLQIQYALVFQQQEGNWLLDGIAVDAVAVGETQLSEAPESTNGAAVSPTSKRARAAKKTETATH